MFYLNNKKIKLDKYEQEIEDAIERGDFIRDTDLKKSKEFWRKTANNYLELQKSKRITIRVNQEDLLKVKVKANKSNIPYQTLLKALIHQFAEGQAQICL